MMKKSYQLVEAGCPLTLFQVTVFHRARLALIGMRRPETSIVFISVVLMEKIDLSEPNTSATFYILSETEFRILIFNLFHVTVLIVTPLKAFL